ncbi:MAG: MATE family efflux transporter [Gemmatimonadaceae bacterium]
MSEQVQHAAEAAETAVSSGELRFWNAVRDALSGAHHDFTQGPISRAILLLAIPMVLEMVMESIFAVVDVFFVARLGADAVATVGLTESLLTLVYGLAMGLGIGATALVARRVGERDLAGASQAAAQALWLGLGLSLMLGLVGLLYAPTLLILMGAEAGVVDRGAAFTRIMLGGNASVLMLFLVNAIFRGAGDAAIAMRVLWLANGINILLGPCLIFGVGPFPRLGVTGAAVATTIGRGTGAIWALTRLWKGASRIRVSRADVRLRPSVMWRLVRLSAAGTVQVMIGIASWILLVRILSTFGSAALAGYTIAMRIMVFALLPSWGLSNAAATMVGQALGARAPARAERAVQLAGWFNMAFLGTLGLAFIVFAPTIIGLFTVDPAIAPTGVMGLRTVASGFLFYAWGMVFTNAFNGAGDTWTPTWINFACFWMWEVPLGWFLAIRLRLGPQGVFLAIAIAYATLAVLSGVLFRRGRWKQSVV